MDRLQKIIDKHINQYYHNNAEFIKYIPKYIIKLYIKKNKKKYYEIGYIYQFYYNNDDLMHKYYNKAIDEGDSNAMNNLGDYYFTEKNYDLMKKYYLDAIKLGHLLSINNLYYYYHVKKYDIMKK